MAIRWTANDSRAYRDVSDAGEKIRKSYEDYLSGQAYKEGAALKDGDKETAQGFLDQAAALPSAEKGDYDNSDYAPGGLGAKSNQQAAALRRQSAEVLSPEARHMAGLQGQQRLYSERGDTRQAGQIGERIEGIRSNQMRMKLGEEELARAPMQRELLQGQIDMQPGQRAAQGLALRNAELDNKVKEFDTQFKEASRKGFTALVDLYDNGISDGFKSKIERDPKTGALAIYRVSEDTGKSELWKKFSGDKRMGITPEMEATAEVKALMGDTSNQMKIIELNQKATSDRERNAVLDKMYSQRASAGSKAQLVDVNWKDESGKVRSGKVTIEKEGKGYAAYDLDGNKLPTDDPRWAAIKNGVPRNTRDDPESNPEVRGINARIKEGKETKEDLARLKQIGQLAAVREQFETAAEGDRTGAVVALFTNGVFGRGGMAETPEAQNQLAAELGISREELTIGRAAARAKNAPTPQVGLGGGGPTPGSPAAKALEARRQRTQQQAEQQAASSAADREQRARDAAEFARRNPYMAR
jgi:hypothetical protein